LILRLACRFSATEGVSGSSLAKSSVSRNIKKSIAESYPALEPSEAAVSLLDTILGDKKQPLYVIKCHDRVQMVAINKEPKFFSTHDEQWLPVLRLLHQYPDLLPIVQVDRGAIKFVLKGADIMAPGLTSAGGDLSTSLPAETYVAIKAEGKEQILAIGKTTMSTDDMKKINKGTAITNLHYLNDGLWNTNSIE
jgi:PUA domain protein